MMVTRVVLSLFFVPLCGCVRKYDLRENYKAHIEQVLSGDPSHSGRTMPPADDEGGTLRVGQWALYKCNFGYERLMVVADDALGLWIEFETQTPESRDVRLISLGPTDHDRYQLKMSVERRDLDPPVVTDFRVQTHSRERAELEYFLSRLLPHSDLLAKPRDEEVDVPAGHFSHAVRSETSTGTQWYHSDAPFDGLVMSKMKGYQDCALYAYGDRASSSVILELARSLAISMATPRRPSYFFNLGIGLGWVSGTSHEASSTGTAIHGLLGARASENIDIVVGFSNFGNIDYSPDITQTQELSHVFAGGRLTALRSLFDVYVQVNTGYVELDRLSKLDETKNNLVSRGVYVGGAIGVLVPIGHDWAAVAQFEDGENFLNSGERLRNTVSLTLVLQAYLPLL